MSYITFIRGKDGSTETRIGVEYQTVLLPNDNVQDGELTRQQWISKKDTKVGVVEEEIKRVFTVELEEEVQLRKYTVLKNGRVKEVLTSDSSIEKQNLEVKQEGSEREEWDVYINST